MINHTSLLQTNNIRFIGSNVVSSQEMIFSNLNLQPEDLIHFSIARTFATVPALPSGWHEVTPQWFVNAPIYVVHWWKYYRPGDTDPYPTNPGRKRIRIYRNAKIKANSVITHSVSSGTSMYIPAIVSKKNALHEWSVFDICSRETQSNIGSLLPANTIKRYSTAAGLLNHIGGDNGGMNDGWEQFNYTQASSPSHAISYILQPRN